MAIKRRSTDKNHVKQSEKLISHSNAISDKLKKCSKLGSNSKLCDLCRQCQTICNCIMHPIDTAKELKSRYQTYRQDRPKMTLICTGLFLVLILPLVFFLPVSGYSRLYKGLSQVTISKLNQMSSYIYNTYGSSKSKINPRYISRSDLNLARNNHKLYEFGTVQKQVPSVNLKSGSNSKSKVIDEYKVFKANEDKSKDQIEYFEKVIWANYTIQNFDQKFLQPLLIERVAGTPGAFQALQHLKDSLPDFYDTYVEKSEQRTPLDIDQGKPRLFQNLVAMSNKYAERQMVLACHYDSKYWPNKNEVFIGATDSAVPCAMLLQLAANLGKEVLKAGNIGLQLIFFDGEEAFVSWNKKDSVYGSNSLANSYSYIEKSLVNRKINKQNSQKIRRIDRIDCFVLLDLLGNKSPKFNHDRKFNEAKDLFVRMGEIERQPKLQKFFKPDSSGKREYYFNIRYAGKYSLGIDDDHRPWHDRGVNRIVHLIPVPFPFTWHEISDNYENLDFDTIWNLQIIIDTFTVEYLRLLEFVGKK